MKKTITVVRKGLVVDVGRFKKSNVDGWVVIYSKAGEMIGGFDLLYNRLKVIHKNKTDDEIYVVYSIIDREEVKK